ncbi:MAG: heavy-metal-associated domain-containing protein [Vicinamibacterales bacterium]
MDVVMETTFSISGMSCGGCVTSVTRVLRSVQGLEPVHVEVGKATVRIDPTRASVDAAKAAIERAGFRVVGEHA